MQASSVVQDLRETDCCANYLESVVLPNQPQVRFIEVSRSRDDDSLVGDDVTDIDSVLTSFSSVDDADTLFLSKENPVARAGERTSIIESNSNREDHGLNFLDFMKSRDF